ncbi:DEAD/DEAH box helicase [Georgenia sp. MJ170]|uniref:DEAD/DEAH box helicase n=1 Tax=Georgenia sunbinii TaxID=3117728 RepID=UPI002F2631F4
MSPRRRRHRPTDAPAAGPAAPAHDAEPSPAERYADYRRRAAAQRTELAAFTAGLGFALDDFQQRACAELEEGRSVLVAAPTGAGKTVVGEFAVHLGLRRDRKTFYTTPIKALSNQKYLDLVAVHGEGSVGLLTGDTTVNGEAPVVVMTTEVLRNMLYAGSPTLDDLGYVVMDEVHYLADRFRGPVWEEVILHLAEDVRLVSLSATVSNAEEFGDWLTMVRGDTAVIVSEHRPVPLWQHVMVRNRLLDLYSARVDPTAPGSNPPINPDLLESIRRAQRTGSAPSAVGRRRDAPRGRGGRPPHRVGAAVRPPSRPVVVEHLDQAGLLPAIVFIFSRAGCEAAVEQTVRSGLRLTDQAESRAIASVIEERCASLPPEDLAVVGYHAWSHALQRGIASHHAGMLPVFKETVEVLFAAGLVKVVYATETLALGINMPARSVVLEQLDKWNGTSHAPLTPGEYTQLTGRAGRRGIDVEGHAVVLYRDDVDPGALAGLASRRTYPLRSRFQPTYNMAVNLLAATPFAQARETLERSFAQFQADRGVVGLARQARRNEEALAGYAEAMSCHLGDFTEYARLRRRLSEAEKDLSRERSHATRRAAASSIGAASPGDVLEYRRGRRTLWAVVLEVDAHRLDSPRLQVLTPEPKLRTLTLTELPHGAARVAQMRIPRQLNLRDARQRADLAASLRNAVRGAGARPERPTTAQPHVVEDVDALRNELRSHPCHGCSEREDHARWANRWNTLDAEHEALLRRIAQRTSSIARDFDKVCELLVELGYLTASEAEDGSRGIDVTDDGHWLARLYAEKDLVLAESLRRGVWQHLDAGELAAVVSTIVYSARTDNAQGAGGRLTAGLAAAVADTVEISDELTERESAHGVPPTEPVDIGIVAAIHRWAGGAPLDEVLAGSDLGAGDFVRWCKQVLDVLDQLATAAPRPAERRQARDAIQLLRRGVVAWSSV